MEDLIQFLEENQIEKNVCSCNDSKNYIYVSPDEGGMNRYAYKDEECTEKYSKEELIQAYKQGAIVKMVNEYCEYIAKPTYLQYILQEDVVFVGTYLYEEVIIASKEYIVEGPQ